MLVAPQALPRTEGGTVEGEERVSLGPQRMAGCQQQLPSLTECAEFRPWLASQTIFFFFKCSSLWPMLLR